jgi:DnaJ family protein C protein 19
MPFSCFSWKGWFGGWGKKYYEGGFKADMDRQEASRILGCRANASKERILNRYRNLMRLNHPDLGGSPYLAGKVNDAKELLVKTARSDADIKKGKR